MASHNFPADQNQYLLSQAFSHCGPFSFLLLRLRLCLSTGPISVSSTGPCPGWSLLPPPSSPPPPPLLLFLHWDCSVPHPRKPRMPFTGMFNAPQMFSDTQTSSRYKGLVAHPPNAHRVLLWLLSDNQAFSSRMERQEILTLQRDFSCLCGQ